MKQIEVVSMPQITEEMKEVTKLLPQERMSRHVS